MQCRAARRAPRYPCAARGQSAADSAAVGAVAVLVAGGTGNYTTEAKATTAQYGFDDGAGGVTLE
jgi:hypothetical protein